MKKISCVRCSNYTVQGLVIRGLGIRGPESKGKLLHCVKCHTFKPRLRSFGFRGSLFLMNVTFASNERRKLVSKKRKNTLVKLDQIDY